LNPFCWRCQAVLFEITAFSLDICLSGKEKAMNYERILGDSQFVERSLDHDCLEVEATTCRPQALWSATSARVTWDCVVQKLAAHYA
jgi:hypothetical protein